MTGSLFTLFQFDVDDDKMLPNFSLFFELNQTRKEVF